MYVLYEDNEVTVLARQGTLSCVIFTDTAGKKQVGWVSSDYLVTEKPKVMINIMVSDTIFSTGVYIHKVIAGSNAEKAGLRPDDVITALDYYAVQNIERLRQVLDNFKIGDVVQVKVQRNGKTLVLPVVLEKAR